MLRRFFLRACLPGLVTLAGATAGPPMMLVDFSTATASLDWEIVNDGVMGGRSRSRFEVAGGHFHFAGEVSLENQGGFASVRSEPTDLSMPGLRAFRLRVKGDGRTYRLTVRTAGEAAGVVYQQAFDTERGRWLELDLPVANFVARLRGRTVTGVAPLDPAQIRSIGFLIADRQAGPFALEVAWVGGRSDAAAGEGNPADPP